MQLPRGVLNRSKVCPTVASGQANARFRCSPLQNYKDLLQFETSTFLLSEHPDHLPHPHLLSVALLSIFLFQGPKVKLYGNLIFLGDGFEFVDKCCYVINFSSSHIKNQIELEDFNPASSRVNMILTCNQQIIDEVCYLFFPCIRSLESDVLVFIIQFRPGTCQMLSHKQLPYQAFSRKSHKQFIYKLLYLDNFKAS